MPLFQPRNRVQILREMVARVISRSKLAKLERGSTVFHALSAAANEDAEQYVQMARLRQTFSIDRANGSDLDERAKEIQPAKISRRRALFASGDVTFSRPGTAGAIAIPPGTQVAGVDADGAQLRFRTISSATIPNLSTSSGAVSVVATEAGARYNVLAGNISKFISRIPGVTSVTNGTDYKNGADRESDPSFRARLKAFTQAISRATPVALEGFARNVILRDGRRVLFAKASEPISPTGSGQLYIDDGTGGVEEFDSTFITSTDTILSSALGGETDIFTANRPLRDDGGFALFVNAVAQVRGTDYELNTSTGQVEFSAASYPTGLTAGDVVTANYRYYIGLIQEVQRIIDGDPSDPLRAPGVRGFGTQVRVLAPTTVGQTLTGRVSVLAGFDPALVLSAAKSAVQDYINGLNIGGDVIAAEVVQRVMDVEGVFNFHIDDLTGSGSGGADQVILDTQVARTTSAGILLT